MAGFEVIVRPVVFPNIRPSAPRAVPSADAPDKGIATISGGSGGGVVELPYSSSSSFSKSRRQEVKRKYDKARLFYTRPDGTTDQSLYWDFEVARRIEMAKNNVEPEADDYGPITEADNVKVIERGKTRQNPDYVE